MTYEAGRVQYIHALVAILFDDDAGVAVARRLNASRIAIPVDEESDSFRGVFLQLMHALFSYSFGLMT